MPVCIAVDLFSACSFWMAEESNGSLGTGVTYHCGPLRIEPRSALFFYVSVFVCIAAYLHSFRSHWYLSWFLYLVIIGSFIYLLCECRCVEVTGQLRELVFSKYQVSFKGQTQVIRLGGTSLDSLRHLTKLWFIDLNNILLCHQGWFQTCCVSQSGLASLLDWQVCSTTSIGYVLHQSLHPFQCLCNTSLENFTLEALFFKNGFHGTCWDLCNALPLTVWPSL